ncbi:hypothetical protein [Nocardioides pantholopis]|uniref:hypothetical protein n=1 Tax=Nocardioides pantholopis TaxID=2483798 RepID=UPI0013DE6211|nr:hypothetical protein [Nocardioides pantholopis]
MTDQNPPKLDIDWVKTAAGALAAVSSAVLLSTLGAAGTLIGAALGSVAATVTTALYSQGLARSKAKVAAVQEQALQKVGIAQTEVRRAGRRPDASQAHLEHAEDQLAEAKDGLDDLQDTAGTSSWRQVLAGLPWKRIALLSAGVFLIAVVAISLFEALSGKPVSSYTGGSDQDGRTSISRLTGSGGDDSPKKERDKPEPSRSPASSTPSDEATPRDDSDSDSDTGSDTDPTPTPSTPSPTTGATPSEQTTPQPREAQPSSTPKAPAQGVEPREAVPSQGGSAAP